MILNVIFEYFNWPIHVHHLKEIPSTLWLLLLEDTLQIKFKSSLEPSQSIQMLIDFLSVLTHQDFSHIKAHKVVEKDLTHVKYLNDIVCAVILDVYPQLQDDRMSDSVTSFTSLPSTGRKRVERDLSETSQLPSVKLNREGPIASAMKARSAILQLRNAARDQKLAHFQSAKPEPLLVDQWRREKIRQRNQRSKLL